VVLLGERAGNEGAARQWHGERAVVLLGERAGMRGWRR
jgi:hypothetical protein